MSDTKLFIYADEVMLERKVRDYTYLLIFEDRTESEVRSST